MLTSSRRRTSILLAIGCAGVIFTGLWPKHLEAPLFRLVASTVRSRGGRPADVTRALSLLDVADNIALYIPVGVLLVARLGRRRWWLAVPVGATLSALLELSQHLWLPGRVGSVQDVASDTIGTAVGAAATAALLGWSRRRRAAGCQT